LLAIQHKSNNSTLSLLRMFPLLRFAFRDFIDVNQWLDGVLAVSRVATNIE
jgi:hypothetical protein